MSWTDLHKFADAIFALTQKLLHITSSNLVRQYILNRGIFLNLFRNLKSDWSLVPGSFCFLIFCPLKGAGFKRKNKGNFLRRFDNALFLKEFLTCNGCFRLLTKIKEGSRTSFLCIFSAWFFIKMLLIQYSIIWTKFHCHNFFPSQ